MTRRVAMAALGPLLLACRPPWTVRRIEDAETGRRFDATEYVDSIWDARVLPAAQQAVSFDQWQRGHAATAQLVKGAGRLLPPPLTREGTPPTRDGPSPTHDSPSPSREVPPPIHESSPPTHDGPPPTHEVPPPIHESSPPTHDGSPPTRAGSPPTRAGLPPTPEGPSPSRERERAVSQLSVDLPPYDGQPDLNIVLGTAIHGTALRDALPFIQFSQFVNQVDFAKVASALNARAAKATEAALPAEGADISFTGAVAVPSDNSLPEIVPVTLSVSRERG
jgi:predicted lipoprotein